MFVFQQNSANSVNHLFIKRGIKVLNFNLLKSHFEE